MTNYFTTNRYISKYRDSESSLLQALTSESISFNGIMVYYLPRQRIENMSAIIRDNDISKFTEAYEIPMYVKSFDGFQGDDILGKFGLEITDQLELNVSKEIFEQIVINQTRPNEGDLVYFPYTKQLFEVHFAEDETAFYQLGKLYHWELKCKLFTYSSEDILTNFDELNNIEYETAHAINLYLSTTEGSGEFLIGELVEQGNSTATVYAWDTMSNVLKIGGMDANFAAGANVIGLLSGSSYPVNNINTLEFPNERESQNERIEDEADKILDFNEQLPFGEF